MSPRRCGRRWRRQLRFTTFLLICIQRRTILYRGWLLLTAVRRERRQSLGPPCWIHYDLYALYDPYDKTRSFRQCFCHRVISNRLCIPRRKSIRAIRTNVCLHLVIFYYTFKLHVFLLTPRLKIRKSTKIFLMDLHTHTHTKSGQFFNLTSGDLLIFSKENDFPVSCDVWEEKLNDEKLTMLRVCMMHACVVFSTSINSSHSSWSKPLTSDRILIGDRAASLSVDLPLSGDGINSCPSSSSSSARSSQSVALISCHRFRWSILWYRIIADRKPISDTNVFVDLDNRDAKRRERDLHAELFISGKLCDRAGNS